VPADPSPAPNSPDRTQKPPLTAEHRCALTVMLTSSGISGLQIKLKVPTFVVLAIRGDTKLIRPQ